MCKIELVASKFSLQIDRQVRKIKRSLNPLVQPVSASSFVCKNVKVFNMSVKEEFFDVSFLFTNFETPPLVNIVPNDYEDSIPPQTSQSDVSQSTIAVTGNKNLPRGPYTSLND